MKIQQEKKIITLLSLLLFCDVVVFVIAIITATQ